VKQLNFISTFINILYTQFVSKFRNKPCSVHVGEYTYGFPKIISFSANERLVIGRYCSIAENVTLVLSEHSLNRVSTFPLKSRFVLKKEVDEISKGPIVIENDVHVGTGAIVLSNVRICNGAVIGAGSVVTKDVPPYAIVAGVPAKIIGFRFEQNQIHDLLKIAWWNWSREKITSNIDHFYGNIDNFIKKFKSGDQK
jgi:lipopolysaccharide transport system ATP-binding protein